MSHCDWMNQHMGSWGIGHWVAMGLGWLAIILVLFVLGFAMGRARRKPSDDD